MAEWHDEVEKNIENLIGTEFKERYEVRISQKGKINLPSPPLRA